jgi:hypothetical protein
MTSASKLPKAPLLPALGAVLVAAWPALAVLTLTLELGGDGGLTALAAIVCATLTWTPLLRACVRGLTEYSVSYATSFGVLVAGALLLVPLAVVASLTGVLGATLAGAGSPLLVAGVLRHHVDWKEPPHL